jgi:DnaJ-class molecular chaperone
MPTMQSKDPRRHHTPDDDPEPGTPGTAEDICPECAGTGKQVDKQTGKQSSCERCDGTGLIVQGIG